MTDSGLIVTSVDDGWARLRVDTHVFPIEIVRRTAFTFVEHCYVFLAWEDEQHLSVTLTTKRKPADEEYLQNVAGEFANEALNQSLRDQLMKDTRSLRELIVGRALFAAVNQPSLADDLDFLDDDDDGDFLDDPLGIAVPWEEKFGKKSDEPAAKAEEADSPDEGA